MMRSHILGRAILSCWCAFAFYCLLSAVAGPAGVVAYRDLEGKVGLMKANLEDLRRRNAALVSEVDSLKSDPDRARREALSLGFLEPGEATLVLSGMGKAQGDKTMASDGPGTVLRLERASPLSDVAAKEIALGLGVAVFAAGLAADLARRGSPEGRKAARQLHGRLGSVRRA